MDKSILKNTKISEYIDLLKAGTDTEKINEIDALLSSKIQGVAGGFDLHLFQMQKDLQLLLCKYIMAMLEFDSKKMEVYWTRIEMLQIAINNKNSKVVKTDPYTSFLQWLLTLKKYYGSDIDPDNDLIYLCSATESMMKWYNTQNQQIEQQKQNRK